MIFETLKIALIVVVALPWAALAAWLIVGNIAMSIKRKNKLKSKDIKYHL